MKIIVLCALISYCLAEAPLLKNNNFNGYAAAGYKPQGPEFRLPTDTSATDIEISEENLEYAGQLGENLPEERQTPNNQYLPPANNNVEDELEGEEVLSEDALRVQALPKEDAPVDFNQYDQYRTFVPPQGRARLRQQTRANFRNQVTRSQKLIAPAPRQKTARLQKARPQPKRQQLRTRPQPKRQQLRQQPKTQQLRARPQKTAQFRQQTQQFFQQQFFPQQQRFVQRQQQKQFAQIRQPTSGRKTQQLRARPAKLQRVTFARQEQAPTDFGDNVPAIPTGQYGAPAVEYGAPAVEVSTPANAYGVPEVDTRDVTDDETQAEDPEQGDQPSEDEVEPEAEQEEVPEGEQGQDGEQEEEKDVEQEDVPQEEEQEQSDEEEDEENQEDEEDSQEEIHEEIQNPDSEVINTDEETAVSIANAVSEQVRGQYYVVTPDNTLQRVRFSTKQTAADKRNNGFTAQLRYSPVQNIKDPIYAYNGQGQLVRIFKK